MDYLNGEEKEEFSMMQSIKDGTGAAVEDITKYLIIAASVFIVGKYIVGEKKIIEFKDKYL